MKKMTSKVLFSLIAILSMFSLTAEAQTGTDQAIIKEWLIANKDKVTLVSSKDYQQMSPSVRALLDADKQTLIYTQEVSQKDLKAFEDKNEAGAYVSFEMIQKTTEKSLKKEEENEKYKVSEWLASNRTRNIKMVSRQDYESRPLEERTYIDNLEEKIIYEGAKLTWEDIKTFQQKKN